ncbi:MAG TPA: serine/threonine-protein kinase, partial [Polyangia bacterium]
MTNSVIEPLAPTPSSGEGADAPRLAPGTVLSHRYYVQRFIARGGMGEVYAVEDLELHQQIALKTIASHRANERGARERFRREVQLSRRVTHPNVCRLFDVGFHEDADGGTIIFYTMELLEGETLAARLARVGRMSREAALPIVEQIAAALDAAHAAGVVHCDFKPHNVLLVARGEGEPPRVVVTDFGLARALDAAKPTVPIEERMFGTPAYMAPEQVRGHEVTPRSDLYALGVTLFQ